MQAGQPSIAPRNGTDCRCAGRLQVMKLTYLSSAIIPSREANSIHVVKMCQAFSRLGHDVMLIAPDVTRGVEADITDIYAFYGVDRCFELRKLPWRKVKGRGWIYGWEVGRFVPASRFRCGIR